MANDPTGRTLRASVDADRGARSYFAMHSVGDESRIKSAWAALAGVERLRRFQFVVRTESWLCPRGWVGLLSLFDTLTVVAPTKELGDELSSRLRDLPPSDAVVLDRV